MIVPIGHDQSVSRWPWVTIAIIVLCTLVQGYAQWFAPNVNAIIEYQYEFDRADTPEAKAAIEQRAAHELEKIPMIRWGYVTGSGFTLNLILSAFVHAGWLHLIGNMLFLWLAGSAVEDRWGPVRFLAFYLGGAAAATLCFDQLSSGDAHLLVGASGAISAVMGAFLVNFASTRITLWYFLMYRMGTFQIPAYVALPLWLGEQVLWVGAEGRAGISGVAYTAHIGGFAFGVAIAFGTRLLHPNPATGSETETATDAPPVVAADPRYVQCLEAIRNRDLATVRTLASRVVLDLARTSSDAKILELYKAIDRQFAKIPLTDGAFVAVAAAADALREPNTYILIADALVREHPASAQVPKVLLRVAELHRAAGRDVDEAEALRVITEKFAHHPMAQKARDRLFTRPA